MHKIRFLTPEFAIAPALEPSDFAAAARLGFRSILNNRPDGEEPGQLSARQGAVLAWRAGLAYAHVPATKHELFEDDALERIEIALRRLDAPMLAFCKSGLRSALLWAAASARQQPVDCVLTALRLAGFDVDHVREDLEAQNHRRYQGRTIAALDCASAVHAPRPDARIST